MKRIDRLLREARLCRVRRAARARGLVVEAEDFDWLVEAADVQSLLSDLAESEIPAGADPRRQDPICVLDPAALAPFMRAAGDLLSDLVASMRPHEVVADGVHDRAVELLKPKQVNLEQADLDQQDADFDPGTVRRNAARDVGVLCVQMALFEVVRDVAERLDRERVVPAGIDPALIVIEGGRARLMKRPRPIANADAIRAAARRGGAKPPAELAPTKAQEKRRRRAGSDAADAGDGAPAITLAMREVRRQARAGAAPRKGSADGR